MSITCTCGHQSPDGARFCANCGRPLAAGAVPPAPAGEEPAAGPGLQAAAPGTAAVAPVSEQTPPTPRPEKPFLDKVWDFFASVPVATVVIFLLAAVSVLGTLIEQEGMYSSWMPPEQYYPTRYGPFWGNFILATGLSHAYTSWWFLALMGMLGISLTVCSIQRGVPLYRAIHKPNIAPPAGFLRHMRLRFTAPAGPDPQAPLAPLAEALRRARYRVTVQGDRLFAEQGRWGRWGPYIVHLGLLIVLLGGMTRAVPGWYLKDFIWIKDGETVPVPGANWSVMSKGFTAETYPDGRPKLYATDAVVIENGQPVKEHRILMNVPLSYQGVELYQSSYRTQLDRAVVQLLGRDGDQVLGEFTVDLSQPEPQYQAGEWRVEVQDYYPDFALDATNRPTTRSREPNNPAFVIQVTGADGTAYGPTWFFPFYPDIHFDESLPFRFNVKEMTEAMVSGLQVKKDGGIPVIYAGLAVVTLGLALTFYLSHRRIWAMVDGGQVLVAGQTNRNRLFFAREFRRLAERLGATSPSQIE